MEEIAPTCDGDSIKFSMPSLQMGSYKIFVASADFGQLEGSIDVSYKFEINSIFPETIGIGGGSLITMKGTGFSADTTGRLCGQNLKFVSFTPPVNSGNEELLVYETSLVEDLAACSTGIELADIDRSNNEEETTNNMNRKRRSTTKSLTVDPAATPTILSVFPKKVFSIFTRLKKVGIKKNDKSIFFIFVLITELSTLGNLRLKSSR